MEVKIGVADSGRELLVTSASEPEEIEAQVTEALKDADGTLVLIDEKGKRLMIPTAKIAYVEIGQSDSRRVGFGS
ncbi:DUF3107 domain-containing protein [Nakamurella lactea]|uniref:DUF3107 domain-containing protein n=1 Tax=Nakamurella lactea TaxID=459515 RepID=UPI0003FB56DD|nr:DUF3107 domain-containing protein [Nakamurella lactea]